ncbi:MAG: hypothetical protein H6807_12870 [Planctomycetes bacterium]|nr:hypothetical protein [Planctomycetota bacterium]
MIHGRVVGELWASVRLASLAGRKLLIVRPEGRHRREDLVAVDLVGAGRGDRVLVTLGRAARNALGDPESAIEAALIAVIDDLEVEIGDPALPGLPIATSPGADRDRASALDPEEADEAGDEPAVEDEAPETASAGRSARKKSTSRKKAASKKSARKKASTRKAVVEKTAPAVAPDDAADGTTGDLFALAEGEADELDPPAAGAEEEPIDYVVERDDDLPGFEDVDAIWGDDEEVGGS